jgi:hypothetical protein
MAAGILVEFSDRKFTDYEPRIVLELHLICGRLEENKIKTCYVDLYKG